MLREGEGVAADILLRCGVTFGRLWTLVRAHLASGGQFGEQEAGQRAGSAVMCRLDERTLATVDVRSHAVAWLVQAASNG